jgi:hypothetical protein
VLLTGSLSSLIIQLSIHALNFRENMKHLLKLKAMGLLILLLTMGYVHAQTVAPARGEGLDNPQITADEYDAYKIKWVQENPEEYALLVSMRQKDNQNGSHRMAAWTSPEEKEKWIAEHPREYAEFMEAQKAVRTEVRPTMTRAEFDALPVGRQQAILNETNTLIIDNNTK